MVTVKMKRKPAALAKLLGHNRAEHTPLNAAADAVNFRCGRPDFQRSPALKRSCVISLFGLDT